MSDLIFIGLDFETSGVSHEMSAPIEFGIATADGLMHDSLIGGWKWKHELTALNALPFERRYIWSDEAEDIHGLSTNDLVGQATPSAVDDDMTGFIRRNVGYEPKKIIAVGWNVAAFDFPFMREYLPKTADSMSYRSVDLNALLFGITQAGLTNPQGGEKRISEERGLAAAWHSAGYDALASIYAYETLLDVLAAGRII